MMAKTVVLICGLIGSGKTTYAMQHFKPFTDLDLMPDYSTKAGQIQLTKQLLKKCNLVAHITCYPTEIELLKFKDFNKRFILIDTDIEKAKTNIIIRNRQRDMLNLFEVLKANDEYAKKIKNSDLSFTRVNVFDKK